MERPVDEFRSGTRRGLLGMLCRLGHAFILRESRLGVGYRHRRRPPAQDRSVS